MARIYISSTYKDLLRERQAAAEAVRRREHWADGMEIDRGSERPPVETSLENVRSCQIYIGLFAWRYGFVPPGQSQSITELEYEEAGRQGIPRLIFLLHEQAAWPAEWTEKDERILGLRARLDRAHTVRWFSSPETLMIEVLTSLDREVGKALPIPRLLPYLSDRSTQETELEEAVEGWRSRGKRRPLACIVHGDEHQCHEQFLDRLAEVSLPRVLERDARRAAITRYPLSWPLGCRDLSQFQQRLARELARQVLARPAAVEEVNQALVRNPGPVLVWTRVLSEECRPAGTLRSFLGLWQRWPDLAPGQELLVVLLLKYQTKDGVGRFRRWLAQRLNDSLTEEVSQLALPLPDLDGTVLSELQSVPQQEVENWIDQHAASFCRGDLLLPRIRRLFDQWETETSSRQIPMESLAAKLTDLLHQCGT